MYAWTSAGSRDLGDMEYRSVVGRTALTTAGEPACCLGERAVPPCWCQHRPGACLEQSETRRPRWSEEGRIWEKEEAQRKRCALRDAFPKKRNLCWVDYPTMFDLLEYPNNHLVSYFWNGVIDIPTSCLVLLACLNEVLQNTVHCLQWINVLRDHLW